jgi:mycothiol synthase
MPTTVFRPARADDLPAVCAMVNRSERHDGAPTALTLEQLTDDLDVSFVDLEADTRVAVEGDEVVGWAWVWNPEVDSGEDRAVAFGEVDPVHRGRGIGRQLLAWSIDRSTDRLRARDHDRPRFIRVYSRDWYEDRHRLYAHFGLEPARWFEELIRPLGDDPIPDAPLGEGVSIVPLPDDGDEETRAVRNATFADHWGSGPMGSEAWTKRLRGHGARPDLSLVAVDDASGAIVGICINAAFPEEFAVTGREEAWIDILGTLRSHRGRGVASALMTRSLEAFRADGFSHAMIGVDSDSPTGANRLYRKLGFEPLRMEVVHQLVVER